MSWRIVFTKEATRDYKRLRQHTALLKKVQYLLELMARNPFVLPYEKLVGDFAGCYSRRINIQHRLIYQIYGGAKVIKVLSMWNHYE